MSFCKIIFISLNVVLILAFDDKIKFPNNETLQLYSVCVIKKPDRDARGICTKLNDCFEIDFHIRNNKNYNHTVCGYEGTEQIVCCPWQTINNPRLLQRVLPDIGVTQINMDSDFKCTVKSNGKNGVLKFIDDCPELQGNIKAGEQDFCKHELCKNLVCCPLATKSPRYNPVCENVDRPDAEIFFRLRVNTPCTVIGLNVTGTYQTTCEANQRNEILSENAVAICTNNYCIPYYCCPVLKPDDSKYCTRRAKDEFPDIEFMGPKCTDSLTNLPGRCRDLVDCPAFRQGRQKFDECGKDCCSTFYCCPDEDYTLQSISMQQCLGYRSTIYRKQYTLETLHNEESSNTICSVVKYPYAGGLRALPGTFPHMAALGFSSDEDSQVHWNCGGSLISEKYILTAAHCLVSRQYGQVKTIRLGSLYLENVTKSNECAEDFTVKRVIPHPSYNWSFVYNDIGLIELDREVKFNFHMRPICLPKSSELPYNLIGMGWGLLGPGGEPSETLYYGTLDTYTYDECNQTYTFNLNRRVLNGIDENTQFCVGSRDTIQSTCTGDSGGPIISPTTFSRIYEIHGITSFGTVCGFANSPGVYTRVYPYVKWIESVVWS